MRKLLLLVGALWMAASVSAQAPEPAEDLAVRFIKDLGERAEEEVRAFAREGGRTADAAHPGRRWAEFFWEYRKAHAGTPAAARAAYEALWMLWYAGQWDEMFRRADRFAANDPAWRDCLKPLRLAAEEKGDFAWVIAKTAALLGVVGDRETRQALRITRALAFEAAGDLARAEAAARDALASAASPEEREEAEALLDEVTRLAVGRPAPLFRALARSGVEVALEEFRGKVVLLNFWASW